MIWSEVVADKSLQNLPYKIELNERGNIEMSPVTPNHAIYQAIIQRLLTRLTDNGLALPKCPINTKKGVRVPDVAWGSSEFLASREIDSFPRAAEICVEMISRSNTKEEMKEKRQLYLESGAVEVWFCDLSGKMTFYGVEGRLKRSSLVPEFPNVVEFDF